MTRSTTLDASQGGDEIWEDVLNDFLEIRSSMDGEERKYLIQYLKDMGIRADHIHPLSAFKIAGHHVMVGENEEEYLYWLYDPKRRKLHPRQK